MKHRCYPSQTNSMAGIRCENTGPLEKCTTNLPRLFRALSESHGKIYFAKKMSRNKLFSFRWSPFVWCFIAFNDAQKSTFIRCVRQTYPEKSNNQNFSNTSRPAMENFAILMTNIDIERTLTNVDYAYHLSFILSATQTHGQWV